MKEEEISYYEKKVSENPINLDDWKAGVHNKTLKIAIIGIGRIGLPTSLMIAKAGYITFGIDIKQDYVEKINQGGGDPPIKFILDEPNLPEILKEVISNGKFSASTDFVKYISLANIIIICVPTPITSQKVPDYSKINEVIKNIGSLKELIKDKIVIIESTVSPLYVKNIGIPLLEKISGLEINKDFWIASCPERADPGNIIKNLKSIPRIVGACNENASKIVASFYKTVFDVNIIQVSNPRTANSVKLIENIFRVVNIAFSNEIAQLSRLLDIDYMEVLKGAKSKYNFLPHYPGPGVGGPCLPANPYFLITDGYLVSFTPNLVRLATEINQRQPAHITELIFEGLNKIKLPISETPIAVLGISYKPDVKDTQMSSVFPILNDLRQYGASITLYDPYFANEEEQGLKIELNYKFIKNNYPIILVHTGHNEFRSQEFMDFLKECKNLKMIIDCQNIYEKEDLPKGIYYIGVGRPLKYLE
ncbi:MAG: nucleotide sugar dehydrogenase [Candidatus Lokiarchaeota archaeon]|nr:nucleotide sugar dehydrogenase [Candidatus Lokiarchaeota archaeon]